MPFSSLPYSPSQPPGSRRGRRQRERLRKKQAHLAVSLGVVLVELLLAGSLLYFHRQGAAEMAVLAADQATQTRTLEGLQAQRQSLEMDLSILVQTRYPQLRKLVLDTVIPLAQGPLGNIRLLKPADRDHELEAILTVNGSAALRLGRARILLFDNVGVQVAAAELKPEAALGGADEDAPWVSRIRLAPDLRPVYFALETDADALQ